MTSKYGLVQLRDVIDIHYGTALKTEHRDEGGEFIVYGSNGPVGKHIDRIVDHPTIIIGRKGSVGAIHYAEFGGWPIDTTYYVQIKNEAKLDLRYLYHFLKQANLERFSIVTAIPGINRDSVYSVKMPLPSSTKEQQRIAAILDKADAIRRKRHSTLEGLADLDSSTFLDLFGDPATNPKEWPMKPIGEFLSKGRSGTRCGPFGSLLGKSDYVLEGIPVWGIDNVLPNRFVEPATYFITEEKYADLTAYSVEEGDILISRAGTVGRMCVARPTVFPSIIGTNLVRVSLDRDLLLPEYLISLFTYFPERVGRGLRSSSDEDAYSFMKTSVLTTIPIPYPGMDLQRRYVKFLDKIESLRLRTQGSLSETNGLFNSLVSRAFRGEL